MSLTKTIVVHAINPDQAADALVGRLLADGVRENSRNGPVIRAPRHTVIEWATPWNRISQDPLRDANPFFHWMEALWMLAGREDVDHVAYYASGMRNYSDDGVTLNGAYGYRWRKAFGTDQLADICCNLSKNPESRREVLTMWSGGSFIGENGPRLGDYKAAELGSKDVCCNLMAVFSIERLPQGSQSLNMTVFNRSNDTVLGATGANIVHFSMLHQLMAEVLWVEMGEYIQSSSNMHLYPEMDACRRLIERREDSEVSLPPHTDVPFSAMFLPVYGKDAPLKPPAARLRAVDERLRGCVLPVFLSIDEKAAALQKWILENRPAIRTSGAYRRIDEFEFPTLVLQYAYGLYKAGSLSEARGLIEKYRVYAPGHDSLFQACSAWLLRRINRRNGTA